jgi:hypothetical protein
MTGPLFDAALEFWRKPVAGCLGVRKQANGMPGTQPQIDLLSVRYADGRQ